MKKKETKIELDGSYDGQQGRFEWIVEPNGTVNHQLFVPKPGNTMIRLMVTKDLWSKAESLSGLGVEEFAWHPEDAAQVLELLRAKEIAVLGGDVYIKRAGRFEPIHENWYAERDPQELPVAFAMRSQSIAREYLVNLMKFGAGERWVTLVLSEPMDFAEEDDLESL